MVKAYAAQLTDLFLQGTKVTGKSVRAVADNCPHLATLDVSRVKDIDDSDVTYLVQNCRSLELLDVSYVKTLTDKSLRAIGRHCHRLTTLRLAFN